LARSSGAVGGVASPWPNSCGADAGCGVAGAGSGAPGRRKAASSRCAMLASAASGAEAPGSAGSGDGTVGGGAIPAGNVARVGCGNGQFAFGFNTPSFGRGARASGSVREYAGRTGSGAGGVQASSSKACGRAVSGVRGASAHHPSDRVKH